MGERKIQMSEKITASEKALSDALLELNYGEFMALGQTLSDILSDMGTKDGAALTQSLFEWAMYINEGKPE